MTARQIIAAGIVHLCTPSPQTDWAHDIQTSLDQRDFWHHAAMEADPGLDGRRIALWHRRAAEIRIGTALGVTDFRTGRR
jgi:hypothetical protein